MWRETKENALQQKVFPIASENYPPENISVSPGQGGGGSYDPSFLAGQIFSKFDRDNDGKLDKQDFEQLFRENPELSRFQQPQPQSAYPDPALILPVEVVTGRLLTHYDETAGVAIPNSAVDQHKRMGNRVLPLSDSYRARYERLRSMLTSRLLPRREHLIQLRRQLDNCSTEVSAARKAIERETFTDTEQIIERLRSVESMRQSSIKHQVSAVGVRFLNLSHPMVCFHFICLRYSCINSLKSWDFVLYIMLDCVYGCISEHRCGQHFLRRS